MTNKELQDLKRRIKENKYLTKTEVDYIIKALEQEPCEDCVSRQAAIDAMYALCDTGETLKENPWRDNPHIDAITDALDTLQPVIPQQMMEEKESCGDCISRQAVGDVIKSMPDANPSYWNTCDVVDREDLTDEIKQLPPVTPKPKIGRWIDADGDKAICDCCNRLNVFYGAYCKHCGAEMKGGKQDG